MTVREELNAITAARLLLHRLPLPYKSEGRAIASRAYEHLGDRIVQVRRELSILYTIGFRAVPLHPQPVKATDGGTGTENPLPARV